MLVTTARRPCSAMLHEARDVAHRLSAPLVSRDDASIPRLLNEAGVQFAYIVSRRHGTSAVRHELVRRDDARRLFVHARQWRLAKASGFRQAPLARALCPPGESLSPAAHIVDATAGLGGTALRISHTFGCPVTAVEVSAPLACLLDYGMRSLAAEAKPWAAAAGRVSVVHGDAAAYLANGVGSSVGPSSPPDAVFLNPCLDIPRKDTEDAFLQQVARCSPISSECLEAALAVATRRVVLRLPRSEHPSALLPDIRPTDCIQGKQSRFWIYQTCPST